MIPVPGRRCGVSAWFRGPTGCGGIGRSACVMRKCMHFCVESSISLESLIKSCTFVTGSHHRNCIHVAVRSVLSCHHGRRLVRGWYRINVIPLFVELLLRGELVVSLQPSSLPCTKFFAFMHREYRHIQTLFHPTVYDSRSHGLHLLVIGSQVFPFSSIARHYIYDHQHKLYRLILDRLVTVLTGSCGKEDQKFA